MELVVFIGLQASGKSTFFRERFASTHEPVSKDFLRHNKNKDRRQKQLVGAALLAGRSVVVDNTNPTVEDRRPLVELGREYGAEVVGYFFDASARECISRNAEREGLERVPDVAIYTTAKKMVEPSVEEGFVRMYRVRLEGSEFKVETVEVSGDSW